MDTNIWWRQDPNSQLRERRSPVFDANEAENGLGELKIDLEHRLDLMDRDMKINRGFLEKIKNLGQWRDGKADEKEKFQHATGWFYEELEDKDD